MMGQASPAENRELVFRMFKRLESTQHLDGAGMGLPLIRRIVQRVGGEAHLEPNEPRGTKAIFRWPKVWPTTLHPSTVPPPS